MRSFWIISVAILVWNLIGCGAYLAQVTADLDALARTDPITAEAFRTMPKWAWAAYAVAVWGGTAAAIALLVRRRIAIALFGISLGGVIVQFGWSFIGYDLVARKGAGTLPFPILIAAITLASLLYARRQAAKGTLR